jgi:purine-binding chemotaxis protein CheW
VLATESKSFLYPRHFVLFCANGRSFAVDVARTQEIIYFREITPVPKPPCYILGIIELRGKIIPVISLKERIGLHAGHQGQEDSVNGGSAYILIVRIADRRAGLAVDEVREVVKMDPGSIHPPDKLSTSEDGRYLEGVFKRSQQLTLILDLDRLLPVDDLERMAQV